jgi:hypothetical protein
VFKKLLLCVAVVAVALPSQSFADQKLSNILYLGSDDSFEGSDFPDIERLGTRVHNAILGVANESGFSVYKLTNSVVDTHTETWITFHICFDADADTHVVGVAFNARTSVLDNYGLGRVPQRLGFIPCDTTITENELRDIFRKTLRR